MLWERDAYLSHLTFGPTGREMVVELFGLLIGTGELWQQQGATPQEIDLTAFAWDRVPRAQLEFNRGPINDLEEIVLEEDETKRVVRDTFGRVAILPKKVATISLPQEFPVEEAADWDRIREWFLPDDSRVDQQVLNACSKARREGAVVTASIWGAYDILRQLMGDENACLSLYEEPEMVEDILETVGEMQACCLERAIQVSPFDILFVHEDFAGKSGPLVGPKQIHQFFKPYYERLWAIAQKGGARLFDLDSDGFIDPVVDVLLDCGINCLHPVEPGAGSDIVRLRKKYGQRLTLRGGIDKFALTRGKAAIDEELAYRLDPCLRGGGTMFALDHRIPSGVTIEAYRYYVERLRALLDLPPVAEDEPGWCRMA